MEKKLLIVIVIILLGWTGYFIYDKEMTKREEAAWKAEQLKELENFGKKSNLKN